ncbi:hypothetical protein GW17_00011910 [Ensete ventricosum]|nr:hypothetical protein GW17_00011910 [Ensete ventricosum]
MLQQQAHERAQGANASFDSRSVAVTHGSFAGLELRSKILGARRFDMQEAPSLKRGISKKKKKKGVAYLGAPCASAPPSCTCCPTSAPHTSPSTCAWSMAENAGTAHSQVSRSLVNMHNEERKKRVKRSIDRSLPGHPSVDRRPLASGRWRHRFLRPHRRGQLAGPFNDRRRPVLTVSGQNLGAGSAADASAQENLHLQLRGGGGRWKNVLVAVGKGADVVVRGGGGGGGGGGMQVVAAGSEEHLHVRQREGDPVVAHLLLYLSLARSAVIRVGSRLLVQNGTGGRVYEGIMERDGDGRERQKGSALEKCCVINMVQVLRGGVDGLMECAPHFRSRLLRSRKSVFKQQQRQQLCGCSGGERERERERLAYDDVKEEKKEMGEKGWNRRLVKGSPGPALRLIGLLVWDLLALSSVSCSAVQNLFISYLLISLLY